MKILEHDISHLVGTHSVVLYMKTNKRKTTVLTNFLSKYNNIFREK